MKKNGRTNGNLMKNEVFYPWTIRGEFDIMVLDFGFVQEC